MAAQWKPIKSDLEDLGVRLVGVGMGTMSLDYWLKNEIFPGELFVDSNNALHSALELQSAGYFSAFQSSTRHAYAAAENDGFKGEMTDLMMGLQLGGVFVIENNEILYVEKQVELAESMNVLKVLDLVRRHC